MTPELKAAFEQYADTKTRFASAAIDLVADARRLNPDMPAQELVTLLGDVFFPIVHQALGREVA